jgi:hypothetical protein
VALRLRPCLRAGVGDVHAVTPLLRLSRGLLHAQQIPCIRALSDPSAIYTPGNAQRGWVKLVWVQGWGLVRRSKTRLWWPRHAAGDVRVVRGPPARHMHAHRSLPPHMPHTCIFREGRSIEGRSGPGGAGGSSARGGCVVRIGSQAVAATVATRPGERGRGWRGAGRRSGGGDGADPRGVDAGCCGGGPARSQGACRRSPPPAAPLVP